MYYMTTGTTLFYDVMQFLPEAACNVRNFHPSNDHILSSVSFPSADANCEGGATSARKVACKKRDTNILIVPAYLASGAAIGVSIPTGHSLDRGDDRIGEEGTK